MSELIASVNEVLNLDIQNFSLDYPFGLGFGFYFSFE
jgi:hypothetical protein